MRTFSNPAAAGKHLDYGGWQRRDTIVQVVEIRELIRFVAFYSLIRGVICYLPYGAFVCCAVLGLH